MHSTPALNVLAFDPGPIAVGLPRAVEALAISHHQNDPETAAHCERTATIAAAIGETLGMNTGQVEFLRLAGLVHDIGKQRLSREILSKRAALTSDEYEVVETHCALGHVVVERMHLRLANVVLQHHERLDGSGYPQRLRGASILPEARILAVADVTDALMSERPYRAALPVEQVCAKLRRERGTTLDGDAVGACLLWLGATPEF